MSEEATSTSTSTAVSTATTSPFGRRHRLSGGIVGREMRAAAPLALTLAMVPSLLPVVLWSVGSWFSHNRFGMPDAEAIGAFGIFASVLTAFLLGVLCGAEEEENQTIEFLLAQPVAPLRVLAEKIAGSALAFLLWAVVSGVLCTVLGFLTGQDLSHVPPLRAAGQPPLLPWWLAAFFVPLGIGVWVRRVIIAAMLSSFFGIVCVCLAKAVAMNGVVGLPNQFDVVGFLLSLLAVLGLLSAVTRYRTRGAGQWVFRVSGNFDVAWKDRRERRLLLICLALGVCAGPIALLALPKLLPHWISPEAFPSAAFVCLLGPLWLASVVLGGTYYSKCEQEPAESFIESLPIAPREMWRRKSRALFAPWLALAILAAVLQVNCFGSAAEAFPQTRGSAALTFVSLLGVREVLDYRYELTQVLLAYGWLLAFPLLFFSVATGLHVRSTIVHLAVTPLLFLGVIAATVVAAVANRRMGELHEWPWPLLLAVALALWVRFVTGRTPLRELAGWQRFLLLLLFAAAVTEVYGLVMLCNWRDVAFLVLGV